MSKAIRSYPVSQQSAVIQRRLNAGKKDLDSHTAGLGTLAAQDAVHAQERAAMAVIRAGRRAGQAA